MRRLPLFFRSGWLIAACLLSACTTLPPAQLGESWQLKGRIGLWLDNQQESSQVDWLQCGDNYSRIRLTGPMGVGGAEIIATAKTATLNYKGDIRHAANAEALASDIGWPIPVSALRHWLRGRPAPNGEIAAHISPNGQITELQQLGWSLQFSYHNAADGDPLPQKIDGRSDFARLKLIVKQWQNAPQECSKR